MSRVSSFNNRFRDPQLLALELLNPRALEWELPLTLMRASRAGDAGALQLSGRSRSFAGHNPIADALSFTWRNIDAGENLASISFAGAKEEARVIAPGTPNALPSLTWAPSSTLPWVITQQ